MGEVSRRLHRRLSTRIQDWPIREQGWHPGTTLPRDIKTVPMLIADGFDPIHAVYVYLQQLSSYFAEGASTFPELKAYARIAGDADETYFPSGPPISPLTRSFFCFWAFYDLQFGRDRDTIGKCLLDAAEILRLNPDERDALQKMSNSRMGIYEHQRCDGPHVRLRELLTDDEFLCHSTSGYRGQHGELWYVRLLPPLLPEMASYHIAVTSPYVLHGATKSDWLQYLRRTLLKIRSGNDRQRLHALLKYGLDDNYWNEFVFQAYEHHQPDAVFLTGIPDLKATLPHA